MTTDATTEVTTDEGADDGNTEEGQKGQEGQTGNEGEGAGEGAGEARGETESGAGSGGEGDATSSAGAAASAEAETVVQIGDQAPEKHEKAPSWVRDLRARNRELEKENRALKTAQGGADVPKLGPKPTLAEADYDEAEFTKRLDKWHEQKRVVDEAQSRAEREQQAAQAVWQGKIDAFGQAKAALKVPDYEDAEALVQETFSERQLAIIVKYAKNPALLVYALGKNPGKAKELSEIKDLLEFGIAASTVEAQLKITTKKAAPPAPEKKVEGGGPKSGAMDNQLERLRAEAAKTGDFSKVHAYRQKKRAA